MGSAVRNENLSTLLTAEGATTPVIAVDRYGRMLTTSAASALPSAPLSGQVKVAVTGTAVQFPSNALTQGVIITSNPTNTATVVLGPSGVNNTQDGTGTGSQLPAGSSTSVATANTNSIYLNGTAGDWVSFIGS